MKKSWAWLFLVVVTAAPAWAQSTGSVEPGAVQQQSNQTQQYYGQQKQAQQPKKPLKPGESIINKTKPAASQPASAGGPSFQLQRVETNSSAILTPGEIRKVTAPFEGRKVNIGDLHKMVGEINNLYKQKGYITARAFLPAQNVKDGVVHLELVEGRVGGVTVTGNKHTVASYYTSRMGLKPGDLIDTGSLEKSLVWFNQTNDTQLRTVLAAGSKFGTTDVNLEAAEPTNLTTTLSFDNAGYDFIGRNRIGLTTVDRSLFGHRDALTVSAYWANGTVSGAVRYEVPVGTTGATVGGSVSYNHISVRSGSLAQLGVNGHFWDFSLDYRQPVLATRHTLVELFAAPHYQRSFLQSRSFQISDAWVSYMEFGDSLRRYDQRGVLVWDNDFSAGEHHITAAHGFFKYDGDVMRVQTLGRGFVAVFHAMGQARLAGIAGLPPSQQFQIGGISTVRGYPQGMLIGDDGYSLSGELDTPLPFASRGIYGIALGRRVKLAFFLDHGGVLTSQNNSFLTGTGGGFIVNFSRYFSGHFDLAGPLQNESNIRHLDFEFNLQTTPPWARLFHRD